MYCACILDFRTACDGCVCTAFKVKLEDETEIGPKRLAHSGSTEAVSVYSAAVVFRSESCSHV